MDEKFITIIVTAVLTSDAMPTATIIPGYVFAKVPCIRLVLKDYAYEEAREISESMIDLYNSTEKLGKLVDRDALLGDVSYTLETRDDTPRDKDKMVKAIRCLAGTLDRAGDVIMESYGTDGERTAAARNFANWLPEYTRNNRRLFEYRYDLDDIVKVVCPTILRIVNDMTKDGRKLISERAKALMGGDDGDPRLTREKAEAHMAANGGNLDLTGTRFTAMPDGLVVPGDLILSDPDIGKLKDARKSRIASLIDGRTPPPGATCIDGLLSKVTELPKGLKVRGSLYADYTALTELPGDLEVGGDIHLIGTPVARIPAGLKTGGDLYCD